MSDLVILTQTERRTPNCNHYLIFDLSQGSVVEMIVCVTGNPTPTVKWFKDGKVGYFESG